MDSILTKKINKIGALKDEINILLEKIAVIFIRGDNPYVDKIREGINFLEESMVLIQKKDANFVQIFEQNCNINMILEIINDNFNKILDKKINVETFLSQTYINETREYNQRVQLLFSKAKKECSKYDNELLDYMVISIVNDITEEEDKILEKFTSFTDDVKKSPESIILYQRATNKILEKISPQNIQLSYTILSLIERVKNEIITDNKKYKYSTNNVFIKNFGLIAITGALDIEVISKIIFPKEKTSAPKDINSLSKLCKKLDYDLILIKKIINRGIGYNINQLINYTESSDFRKKYESDDGITEDIVKRYNTINYTGDKSLGWSMKYNYLIENSEHVFVLVLEEIYKNKFCILSNKLDADKPLYFIRKTHANEMIEFAKAPLYKSTRVGSYNRIINQKIIENMFLPIKPDVETIKIRSQVIDSKYLRNEIYILILSKFKELYDKTKINNLYDYNKLIHDNSYGEIFSRVIMNEYIRYLFKNIAVYESDNISISEIYSSFLFILNIYERDFKKKLHDIFLVNMPNRDIFKMDKKTKDQTLNNTFDKILSNVLHSIITNENNIFQSILYKLYLFKLSLI